MLNLKYFGSGLITLSYLLYAKPAYAYIDSGTFNMILQALVAGVVGGMVGIKVYWHKIVTFFTKKNQVDE
jgi:hypothetical protein